MHDSERESDKDDLLLLEDNRRSTRESRISREEEDSDDSFIEDDIGLYCDEEDDSNEPSAEEVVEVEPVQAPPVVVNGTVKRLRADFVSRASSFQGPEAAAPPPVQKTETS